MTKTIHIHIHSAKTADAWEESKHPRAANGQFGSGGGGAKASPRPVTATERKEPGQVRSDVIGTINKRLASGTLSAESKKELLEKKARLLAAQSAPAKQVQSATPASGGGEQKEAPARPKQRSNAKTESYSWGKLTSVSNPSITAVAHPEDRQAIHALGDGEVYKYTDEQKHKWEVSRHGDEVYFTEPYSKTAALTAKRSDFE